jgi:hypothetical protein
MNASEELLKRLPNDIGGVTGQPIKRIDHVLEPWEKRCHALADVLDFHKIVNTEEKRRGVESLGSEIIGRLSYYERWVVVFTNVLFQKGILSTEEFARKMDEVASRWAKPTEA